MSDTIRAPATPVMFAEAVDLDWLAKLRPPAMTPEREAEIARLEAEAAELERRREAQAEFDRFCLRVPKAYRWALATPHTLDQRRVQLPDWVGRAETLARRERVLIMGPAGTGKTSLAVRMLRCLYDRRQRGAFVPAHHLGTARIQHAAGQGEAPLVSGALDAPWLVLDDMGSERESATNAVPDVIFERYEEERPTWVTTGLTREQLVARYGDGIARRLFERATIVRLGKGAT